MTSPESTPEADTNNDTASSPNPIYVSHLSQHLEHTRLHLSGDDGHALPPSMYSPCTYWTGVEKNAFFHGLTIYSRLRPDLIAARTGTKSVADVCMYLDMLAEGAAQHPASLREDHPIATEVSDDRLAAEEEHADALIAYEPQADDKALQAAREDEVRNRRLTIRAKKGEARTASWERDRDGEKERKRELETWMKEKEEEWEAEDCFRAMDLPALRAVERILNQADGADHMGDVVFQSVSGREQLGRSSTERAAGGPSQTTVDEVLIDPALLLQPQDVTAPAAASFGQTRNTSEPPQPHHDNSHLLSHTHFQPSTPPFQSTPLPEDGKSIVLDPVHPSTRSATPESQLSPAARRRLRKRLHMRKKRALAQGGVVIDTMEKLKPGRKRKEKATKMSGTANGTPDESRLPHDVNVTEPPDEPVSTRHPHPSGLTGLYKSLERLSSIGFDADRLDEEGLGLFHLSALAQLMGTYNKLHDVSPLVGSQISGEVIRLLYAHVVNFTTQVMLRAIVAREQELAAKINTKAWRLGENQNVTLSNIEHALSLLGLDGLSKKAHFASLSRRIGLNPSKTDEADNYDVDESGSGSQVGRRGSPYYEAEESDEASADGGQDGDNENHGETNDQTKTPTFPDYPLHRIIFHPMIHLSSPPTIWPPDSIDASAYTPWPAVSESMEPFSDDQLMSDETDDDALLAELLEEDQIEARDWAVEKSSEDALWARFEGEDGEGDTGQVGIGAEAAGQGRKRKRYEADTGARRRGRSFHSCSPDPHGPFKSSVYVDSDIE